ncbi:MAG: alpha-ketoglutaric semialdehyde dehydrogenase [Planctomycetota bacterium]|jgi:alpha-ketoglutaric semialdehyde dehydrogenase
MAELQGMHFIAGSAEASGGEVFHGVDPVSGKNLEPGYAEATPEQVARACEAAAAAAPAFAATDPAKRAALLRAIADGLVGLGDELVKCVQAETALPAGRVEGERARTVMQLQQFAALLEDGSWVDARIDHGDATRSPMPKPDLRRMSVPLGPVVVFGASNFPLAYSVAGGDTASAFAAGCPVIIKGHPAHPGTTEMVGRVVFDAVKALGLPAGTFSLLHGRTQDTGGALVKNAAVKAVGFTGSHGGGRALFNQAADRAEPIPVFAEMGSANPLVVLPNALARRGSEIAEQVAASCLLAQGQFCTSPGLVLWLHGEGDENFRVALRERLCSAPSGPTVHSSIRSSYERAIADVSALPVEVERATASAEPGVAEVCPALLRASPQAVLNNERLRSEIYGPAMLTVPCRTMEELTQVIEALDGHLTATVHGDGDDFMTHQPVLDSLRRKVGRIIANGVPTGVEVSPAMVHGGPYPAASDSRFSAVGTTSIQRWVRPACWQDWPQELLPAELRDENPRGIQRLVNGKIES